MRTVLLLTLSNIFMTFAWYGHLKWFPKSADSSFFPLKIIVISWGIAFFEYCFQVPANRIGEQIEGWNLGQLKIVQEAITLAVFVAFSLLVMRESLSWRFFGAFVLILGAVALVFVGRK